MTDDIETPAPDEPPTDDGPKNDEVPEQPDADAGDEQDGEPATPEEDKP